MNIYRSIILVFCMVAFAQAANAQYGGSPGFSSQSSLAIRQHIQRQELRNAINRRRAMNRSRRLSNKRGSVRSTPIKKVATGPSSFIVKELILPNEFAETFKGSESEKRNAIQQLRSFWKGYEAVALKDGFPSNDLAYTLEYYVIHNYAVYNDYFNNHRVRNYKKRFSNGQIESDTEHRERTNLKITNPIERKIYGQYKDFLTSDNSIKKMSNEQKQLFAELLVAVTKMTFDYYVQSKNYSDQNKHKAIRNAAKTNLENLFGVDADKIKITKDGLSITD